jgi:hypothetical protein
MRKKFPKFLGLLLIVPFVSTCAESGYLPGSIAAYDAIDCAPVVEQEVTKLSIDRENISKIEYLKTAVSEGEIGERYDFEAWMSFRNCKGNFVIKMNRSCQISTVYPRGECQLNKITKTKS